MNNNERKVYLETRLRNLERKYSKLCIHADLIDETLEIKKEMDLVKSELMLLS